MNLVVTGRSPSLEQSQIRLTKPVWDWLSGTGSRTYAVHLVASPN